MVQSIPYVVIPFFVGALAQVIKLLIDYYYKRPFSWNSLRTSGWFPSTHGTLTSSALTMVFFVDGLESTLFMVVATISFLVWYDAANVRYESGKHAQYINLIKKEIQQVVMEDDITLHDKVPLLSLKERIGHTPLEVIGGIFYGTFVTVILIWIIEYFCMIPIVWIAR